MERIDAKRIYLPPNAQSMINTMQVSISYSVRNAFCWDVIANNM